MLTLDLIAESCLKRRDSLADGLQALNGPGMGIAFIVDDSVLVGVISDGDVRRALLGGADLTAPVEDLMSTEYVSVSESATREQVLNLMLCLHLKHIPVLNGKKHLIGLHMFDQTLALPSLASSAVVFCGGKGMRLRPITESIPKPMVRVGGRPILERIVLQLVAAGVREIFLATHYLGHMIEEYFGDGSRFGCEIRYLREEVPLGTAGALGLLNEVTTVSSPVLVMNGDLQLDFDVRTLFGAHKMAEADLTMGLFHYRHQVPFGCVNIENGKIDRIDEKPQIDRLVNAGIYVISPQVINNLVPEPRMMNTLVEEVIASGLVHGIELDGEWMDLGTTGELARAINGGV